MELLGGRGIFVVRGQRFHEEYMAGRATLEYCKTDNMFADALTKLANAPVVAVLHHGMDGGSSSDQSRTSSAVLEESGAGSSTGCEPLHFAKKKNIYAVGVCC